MKTAPSNIVVVGVDPGLKGCVAIMFPKEGHVEFVEPQARTTKALCYNTASWLRRTHDPLTMKASWEVYFEKCLAYPPMGLKSAFNFGRGVQALYDAFAVLRISITEVEPKVWQKPFALSKNKELTEKFVRAQLHGLEPIPGFRKGYGYFDAFAIGLYALKFVHQMETPRKWTYQIIR